MALTAERDTNEIANGAKMLFIPVKTGTTIYQGAMVALDASGFAIPAKKATGLTAVGRAEESVINATDGMCINVKRGVFRWSNSTTNALTAAHLLKPCYMEDDQTVGSLATGSSVAGLVVGIDESGVAVEIIPVAAATV